MTALQTTARKACTRRMNSSEGACDSTAHHSAQGLHPLHAWNRAITSGQARPFARAWKG